MNARGSETTEPAFRAPPDCPVCGGRLATTRLGCGSCGTELSGAFRACSYCGLADDELEMLRVFLVSRGNMRELERHLGVSYPTARQRYADLMVKIGFESARERGTGSEPSDREQVLRDLAAGRIDVDAAEALLRPSVPQEGTVS